MRSSIRLTLLAFAGLAALMLTSAAWGAYTPRLVVAPTSHKLGQPNVVQIGVQQTAADDPTAKIDIFVPSGYQENLTAPAGTVIGVVEATVILRGAGNAEVDVTGQVVAANPASHVSNACAPGLHNAVWILQVTLAGTPVQVPIYVDDVTTIAGVSSRIQLCLAGPIGTPSGSQLLAAAFEVRNVFTNPSARAVYTWSALFTPYTPGTPNPNAAGTVESRAVVPLPVTVTIRTAKKGRNVTISGNVSLPGALIPTAVQIFMGTTLRRSGSARVNTSTSRFSVRKRLPRRGKFIYFQARITLPAVDITSQACTPPSRAPRGCVTATMAPVTVRSNIKRVRNRR